MDNTLALPMITPAWARRLRRWTVLLALAAFVGVGGWSLDKMASDDGMAAEIAGYRINAVIDDKLMLNLTITLPERVRPVGLKDTERFFAGDRAGRRIAGPSS